MPPVKFRGDGRMAKNPMQTLARLFRYMKPYLGTIIVVCVCILLTTLAQVASNIWWTTTSPPFWARRPRTMAR